MAGKVARRCLCSLRRRFIFAQALLLEKSETDERSERVMVKAAPRAAFKVVEAEFFFELLMSLLAGPARFECASEGLEWRTGGMIGEVILDLAGGATLGDEPSFIAR